MTEPRRPRPVVQLTLMRLREMLREPGVQIIGDADVPLLILKFQDVYHRGY